MTTELTEALQIVQISSDPDALTAGLAALSHTEHEPAPDDQNHVEPSLGDKFRASFVTGTDLWKIPPPTWLVTDLLVQKSVVMLYGQSGVGKSFVAIEMAGAIITGQDCLGVAHDNAGPVVYLAGEGGEETAKRMLGWCEHHGVDRDVLGSMFHLRPHSGRLHDPHWTATNEVVASIAALKPRLVFVDTLHTYLLGASDSEDKAIAEFIAACVQIAQTTGATVVFIHHPKKGSLEYRGSGALYADSDTVLELDGDVTTHSNLRVKKQKGTAKGEPFTVGFTTHHGTHPVTLEPYSTLVAHPMSRPDTSTTDDAQADLLRALDHIAAPGQQVTSRDWATAVHDICEWKKAALKSDGTPSTTFANARAALVKTGRVVMHGTSNRSATWSAPEPPEPPEQLTMPAT